MNRRAIERIVARWEEYGPVNTGRGRMIDVWGKPCAMADICIVDLGMNREDVSRMPNAVAASHVCAYLGIHTHVLRALVALNDALGVRPVAVLRDMLNAQHASGYEGRTHRRAKMIPSSEPFDSLASECEPVAFDVEEYDAPDLPVTLGDAVTVQFNGQAIAGVPKHWFTGVTA